MRICVIRHAIAEERGPPPRFADSERALTAEGILRMRRAASGLSALKIRAEVMYSSPYRRAKETALIVAEAIGHPAGSIRETNALTPEAHPSDLFELLSQSKHEHVVCVGHCPNVESVVVSMLRLNEDRSGVSASAFTFKKGGAAMLDFDPRAPGSGALIWFMAPKILRQLGGEQDSND